MATTRGFSWFSSAPPGKLQNSKLLYARCKQVPVTYAAWEVTCCTTSRPKNIVLVLVWCKLYWQLRNNYPHTTLHHTQWHSASDYIPVDHYSTFHNVNCIKQPAATDCSGSRPFFGYQSAPFCPNSILPVSSAVSSCYFLRFCSCSWDAPDEVTVYF
jgi:hypothetical protein